MRRAPPYTRPTGSETRPDIIYTPERATAVLPNARSSADIIPAGVSPGPGSLETVTVRSTHPVSTTVRYRFSASPSAPPRLNRVALVTRILP